MWQRGRTISKRDWTLLRVAVVACVNDVYYGRLFFGDPETQQVLWDCDVRPSDATFLALKVRSGLKCHIQSRMLFHKHHAVRQQNLHTIGREGEGALPTVC